VVAVLGPRQSGKTTLVRNTFGQHKYISLENLDLREIATHDPRQFLESNRNEHGIILDEFQNVPTLLSYIQTYVDQEKLKGYFILTGSQNFLVNQAISQTLAGRIAILTLLPLSIKELKESHILPGIDELIFNGCYPRIYGENVLPSVFYPSYTLTYIERDVRQITQVTDLTAFKRFVQLCAGRIGQFLNISSLATDCGISQATAKAWLSLLEASYIIFLLQPHYQNFSKRLIKTPKLYFYDTGLACSLLGLDMASQVSTHYLRGALFESLIISDLYKCFYNTARAPRLYFWRDNHGHEIDCIIEKGQHLMPIEIKASRTIHLDFFKGLQYWLNLAGTDKRDSFVIYGGDNYFTLSNGTIVSWKEIDRIFSNRTT
ncbi:MAG TPA: ATP-binding protein, partial [Candidatus Babeliaceae bacterium]|nr:ATP-binding protein [Candidatus Babeliaceae bacterium]